MIERSYRYDGVRFSPKTVRETLKEFKRVAASYGHALDDGASFTVISGDAEWKYDNESEFFAALPKAERFGIYISSVGGSVRLNFQQASTVATASVKAKAVADVVDICLPMDDASLVEKVEQTSDNNEVVVFIGHGGNPQWKELRDHLRDKHNYTVECYEAGARAGHSIRDILGSMIEASSFALLVMTGEDEQSDGAMRARQNVIHEAGLFQGRLGFSRAIILLEQGVEEFSNVQGVQYIPFQKGNIKETFGDVLATIRREFHSPPS